MAHRLHDLTDRLIHHGEGESEAGSQESDSGGGGGGGGNDPLPVPDYDRYSDKELLRQLHHYTQAELNAIEAYERSHGNRIVVINKLHYMHTRQPLENYDDMTQEEVLEALAEADIETIKHIRGYEHKFGNRPPILEAAHHLHHQRLAEQGPRTPPPYQPGGGSGA